MDAIKFPLTFANGELRKLSSTSDEYYGQLIALTIQTIPGELVLRPTYGVDSPEFDSIQTAKFSQIAAQFLPEVSISGITTKPSDNGLVDIAINFERLDNQ